MSQEYLLTLLKNALDEDCPNGDVTADLLLDPNALGEAKIVVKSAGIFFGEAIVESFFYMLDPNAMVYMYHHDGDAVKTSDVICRIRSFSVVILKLERVLLNFLQRLSGVATITHQYVQALHNPHIQILDTRKTTPLIRVLERQAVLAGGGYNHRFGLSDMLLIKENHLYELRRSGRMHLLPSLIRDFQVTHPGYEIEVEVRSCQELDELDLSAVDIIMFDNFAVGDIPVGIRICRQKGYRAALELSGNINLNNIHMYSQFDVQRISIGNLTHSVPVMDLSLLSV